jgi:hypothetical protein
MCFRILSVCFVSLFFAACSGQEQTEAINKITEVKIVPKQATEKPIQQKPRPALKLSVDNISLDHQGNNDDIFNIEKESTETHSVTFETLTRDKKESDINVSGKLLTDEEKIDNKEYLDSIEGLQINIEGSFQ